MFKVLAATCLVLFLIVSFSAEALLYAPPKLERDQFVQTPPGIEANTVVEAATGGFVVAGSAASSAWARAFDKSGRTLWEYTSQTGPAGYPPRIPRYYGAASMPDGSTFLCGSLGRKVPTSESSALLTHLDAGGKRLSESTIVPKTIPGSTMGNIYFQTCAPMGSHLVLKGVALVTKDGAGPGRGVDMHWFVNVDANGRVVWQSELPTSNVTAYLTADAGVLLPIGSDIYFSNTDNRQTELLHLDVSGKELKRITLPGPYRLVRSVKLKQEVTLWGMTNGQAHLVRFDRALKKLGDTSGSFPYAMSTSVAFQLGDDSLWLFGSSIHNVGQRFRPAAARVDASLRKMQIFEPTWAGASNVVADLRAAAPYGDDGGFITAVAILRADQDKKGGGHSVSGVALDYWRER